jgi:hypothetical protein
MVECPSMANLSIPEQAKVCCAIMEIARKKLFGV